MRASPAIRLFKISFSKKQPGDRIAQQSSIKEMYRLQSLPNRRLHYVRLTSFIKRSTQQLSHFPNLVEFSNVNPKLIGRGAINILTPPPPRCNIHFKNICGEEIAC
jgi:hypothetical protein